jgi:AcrR family transcriptional regulator
MRATKERLLNAAGEIFAEKGFHATSVREICEKAEANLASVNYHFGSKENLYEAVVHHTFDSAMEKYPPDLAEESRRSPEERLFGFVHRFLLRVLDRDRPDWHVKVLQHEHAMPSPAFQAVLAKVIHKNRLELFSILTDLAGPDSDEEWLRLCESSIVGQCLFYHRARQIVSRWHGHVDHSPAGIEKLARHITDFSLAALATLIKCRKTRKRSEN